MGGLGPNLAGERSIHASLRLPVSPANLADAPRSRGYERTSMPALDEARAIQRRLARGSTGLVPAKHDGRSDEKGGRFPARACRGGGDSGPEALNGFQEGAKLRAAGAWAGRARAFHA